MAAPRFFTTELHRNAEWLRGLKPGEVDLILAAARSCRFPAKSVMTFQGDPADHLLMMWEGRARYFFETPRGKKVILMWIRPGDVFGATALVSQPSFYLSSTETVRDSIVLVWDRQKIRALAHRFPQLLENVLLIATNYFYWYVSAHAALVSQSARERLAHVISGLAESIGEKVSGFIEIDVTNEELASSANITPYTASRMVSNWERDGVIGKKRGKILIRFPEKLFLRAAKP
jgi:CRP/FNR family transcriptional regulator, nitrogen oxide reductase regulator